MKRLLTLTILFAAFIAGIWCAAVAARPNVPAVPRYGAISMLAWSADGAYMAFVYQAGGNSDVYIVDANGENLKNVSAGPAADSNPVWSPSGARLLFTSNRNGNMDIFMVDVEGGGGARPVTFSRRDDMWPSWKPDGSGIAYCGYENGYPQVFTIAIGGGAQEAEPFYEERACYPAYSPDGKRLALSSFGDLIVFTLSNMKSKNITEGLIEGNMVDDTMPVWSPRGNLIAFIGRYEAYSAEIYTISPSGKKIRRITEDLYKNFIPRWRPDGKGVIYSAFAMRQPPEIFVSTPDGPEKDRLTDNFKTEMNPCFVPPDGEKILYIRRDNEKDELYIMDKDGSNQEPFLKEELPRVGR